MESKILSPEQVAEIEARLKAATPGPWLWEFGDPIPCLFYLMSSHGECAMVLEVYKWAENCIAMKAKSGDAGLIAHAPTDIAALIDSHRALVDALFYYSEILELSQLKDHIPPKTSGAEAKP